MTTHLPLADVEFWTDVIHLGQVWTLTDKQHQTEHCTLRGISSRGGFKYLKVSFHVYVVQNEHNQRK